MIEIPGVDMRDVQHVIHEIFIIHRYLDTKAASFRDHLLASYGRAKRQDHNVREHFILHASRLTELTLSDSTGRVRRSAAMREMLRRNAGKEDRAQLQTRVYILLYVVDRASKEDEQHGDAWEEMRGWLAQELSPPLA